MLWNARFAHANHSSSVSVFSLTTRSLRSSKPIRLAIGIVSPVTSIIAAHQIERFPAGDFQPLCIHILLPCVLAAIRKSDSVSGGFPCHTFLGAENILPTKPLLIYQIVLHIADPAWCEHFSLIAGAICLILPCFFYTRLNQTVPIACDEFRQNFFFEAILLSQFHVIISCSNDVFLGGLVLKQNLKEGVFVIQKILLQQVDPCNVEHSPHPLQFINIITYFSTFVNVHDKKAIRSYLHSTFYYLVASSRSFFSDI